jgi:hypothetical protein
MGILLYHPREGINDNCHDFPLLYCTKPPSDMTELPDKHKSSEVNER